MKLNSTRILAIAAMLGTLPSPPTDYTTPMVDDVKDGPEARAALARRIEKAEAKRARKALLRKAHVTP